MSARPLDWHKECLRNWTSAVEQKRHTLARLVAELERAERELAFYAQQIKAAEKKGMAAFDCDRLLVKRSRG